MTLLLSIFPTVQAVSDKVIAAEISSLNVFFKILPPLINVYLFLLVLYYNIFHNEKIF